jgi:hypothetical protein
MPYLLSIRYVRKTGWLSAGKAFKGFIHHEEGRGYRKGYDTAFVVNFFAPLEIKPRCFAAR